MTAQAHERLLYEGEWASIACQLGMPDAHPRLTQLTFFEMFHDPTACIYLSTDCQRGYVGEWEIKDGRLYLLSIDGRYKLKGTEPLFADWVCDVLRIPQGVELQSVNSGFDSVYAQELFVTVEHGIVTTTVLVDNRIDNDGLREVLTQCAAGMLVDTRWVGWAEQKVTETDDPSPAMLALAGVVLDPSKPWQAKEVTDLLRPVLESLGYDLSDPIRLVHEYALIALFRYFQGKRELGNVVNTLAQYDSAHSLELGFQDFSLYAEMRSDVQEKGTSRLGGLAQVEGAARLICKDKAFELAEQLRAVYGQKKGVVSGDLYEAMTGLEGLFVQRPVVNDAPLPVDGRDEGRETQAEQHKTWYAALSGAWQRQGAGSLDSCIEDFVEMATARLPAGKSVPIGKAVVLDVEAGVLDPLHWRLPWRLRARRPEAVTHVVGIRWEKKEMEHATQDADSSFVWLGHVWVLDLARNVVMATERFYGDYPTYAPHFSSDVRRTGRKPEKDMIRWLKALDHEPRELDIRPTLLHPNDPNFGKPIMEKAQTAPEPLGKTTQAISADQVDAWRREFQGVGVILKTTSMGGFAEAMAMQLRHFGLTTHLCESVDGVLSLTKELGVALHMVITDLRPNDMPGVELLERLNAEIEHPLAAAIFHNPSFPPVTTEEHARMKALGGGLLLPQGFHTIPYDLKEVIELIRRSVACVKHARERRAVTQREAIDPDAQDTGSVWTTDGVVLGAVYPGAVIILTAYSMPITNLMANYLRISGLATAQCETAANVLDTAKMLGPSLHMVITDLYRPRVSGLELLEELGKIIKHPVAGAIYSSEGTVNEDHETRMKALSRGLVLPQGFHGFPIDFDPFLGLVRKSLEAVKQARSAYNAAGFLIRD